MERREVWFQKCRRTAAQQAQVGAVCSPPLQSLAAGLLALLHLCVAFNWSRSSIGSVRWSALMGCVPRAVSGELQIKKKNGGGVRDQKYGYNQTPGSEMGGGEGYLGNPHRSRVAAPTVFLRSRFCKLANSKGESVEYMQTLRLYWRLRPLRWGKLQIRCIHHQTSFQVTVS